MKATDNIVKNILGIKDDGALAVIDLARMMAKNDNMCWKKMTPKEKMFYMNKAESNRFGGRYER